jgi:uncharacterized protein YegP (UPF0339 family)
MGYFDVYLASDGFRWRLTSAAGEPVAASGCAFLTRQDCLRSIETVQASWSATVRWPGEATAPRAAYSSRSPTPSHAFIRADRLSA